MSQDQMIVPSSTEGIKDSKASRLLVLTPFQRRIVGYGLTSLCACLLGGAVAILLFLTGKISHILMPAFFPVILGLFLSFLLRPAYNLTKKHLPDNWAFGLVIFLLVVFVLCIVICLFSFLGPQLRGLINILPKLFEEIAQDLPKSIQKLFASSNIAESIASKYGPGIIGSALGALGALASFVNVLFALFFSYWFLKCPIEGAVLVQRIDKMIDQLSSRYKMFRQNKKVVCEQIVTEFNNVMTDYFPKQIGIHFLEGAVGAFGFWYFDIPGGIVLGFLMGFLNVIPLFGTFAMLPIVFPVAYWAHLCKGYENAPHGWVNVLIVFLIWLGIEGIDNVLPAKRHGKRLKMASWLIVFSYLFWGAVLDPVWGLILAIPLTAFVKSVFFPNIDGGKEGNNE